MQQIEPQISKIPFEAPVADVMYFQLKDIITTSGNTEDEDWGDEWDDVRAPQIIQGDRI